jgi:hypothetical protein
VNTTDEMHQTAMFVAREIKEAHNWVRYARARAARSSAGDDAVRLHYCEQWLASLLRIARALP